MWISTVLILGTRQKATSALSNIVFCSQITTTLHTLMTRVYSLPRLSTRDELSSGNLTRGINPRVDYTDIPGQKMSTHQYERSPRVHTVSDNGLATRVWQRETRVDYTDRHTWTEDEYTPVCGGPAKVSSKPCCTAVLYRENSLHSNEQIIYGLPCSIEVHAVDISVKRILAVGLGTEHPVLGLRESSEPISNKS